MKKGFVFAFVGIGLFALVLILQIRARPVIPVGMPASDLERSFGQPAQVLTSETFPCSAAGGFVYSEAGSTRVIRARELPPLECEAWYYPYGPLGTTCLLVYLGADRKVVRVYEGGT